MFYKNPRHEINFLDYMNKVGMEPGADKEYTAALYILAGIGKPLSKYIRNTGIDFQALQNDADAWSSGEKALIRFAANIFGAGAVNTDIHGTLKSLDADNIEMIFSALRMRYGRGAAEPSRFKTIDELNFYLNVKYGIDGSGDAIESTIEHYDEIKSSFYAITNIVQNYPLEKRTA